jgi:hypothetical protein
VTFVIVPTAENRQRLHLSAHARPQGFARIPYPVFFLLSLVPPLDRYFFLRQVANPFVDVGVN